MPDMNGLQLADTLRKAAPDLCDEGCPFRRPGYSLKQHNAAVYLQKRSAGKTEEDFIP